MSAPFEKTHFIWLTIALIALLMIGAISRSIPDNMTLHVLEFSTVGLLLLSLMSLNTERKLIKWFVLIIGLMLSMTIVQGYTETVYTEYTFLALLLVFMLLAAWLVGSQVLLTGSVDLNKIVGSVALYLIIGMIFSIFYVILLEFSPHALNGIESTNWYDNMPTTTYFSFVTLATLGYGEIHPATPVAQVIAIIEAITGLFYMAVIVAGLIGAKLKN
jgi:hypothetical protein